MIWFGVVVMAFEAIALIVGILQVNTISLCSLIASVKDCSQHSSLLVVSNCRNTKGSGSQLVLVHRHKLLYKHKTLSCCDQTTACSSIHTIGWSCVLSCLFSARTIVLYLFCIQHIYLYLFWFSCVHTVYRTSFYLFLSYYYYAVWYIYELHRASHTTRKLMCQYSISNRILLLVACFLYLM